MKKFIKKYSFFIAPLIIVFLSLYTYNFVLDPYGVLRGNMDKQMFEPNLRYLKMKHILNYPQRCNAFLFGSSRVAKIDPRNINDQNKWYNFYYAEGLPVEHLKNIKKLLDNDVEVNRVLIGLDNISYLIDPERNKSVLNRKHYENRLTPYVNYMFLWPSPKVYKKIKKEKEKKYHSFYDVYNSGMSTALFRDEWINKDKLKHINNEKFKNPAWVFYYKNRTDKIIKEIAEIIKLCDNNNIEVTFFINPMHVVTYLKQDLNDYYYFLEELSKLTSFYDFSGINEITTNNFNYYETSHFRSFIGDIMIEELNNNSKNRFGKWVDINNVNETVNEKIKDAEEYLKKK